MTLDLLRFTTAGSVDDGKSTLIGRLLYDSKQVFEDQLEHVAQASERRGGEGALDLALLTDGLRAEREQGITIDVAYRYFATRQAPLHHRRLPRPPAVHAQHGHRRLDRGPRPSCCSTRASGVLEQSKRHAFISALLGIPEMVVAVNKMDLVEHSQERFEEIVRRVRAASPRSSPASSTITYIPISALNGDNVVDRSERMPWYDGPVLLDHLEQVEVAYDHPDAKPARFPVQWVIRPRRAATSDYRGYAGQLASGALRRGDEVAVLPSGARTRIAAIDTYDGELDEAIAPMSLTLRLEDELDVSRGELICHPERAPVVARELLGGRLLDDRRAAAPRRPLPAQAHLPQRRRRSSTGSTTCVDVHTLERDRRRPPSWRSTTSAACACAPRTPLVFDPYTSNRRTGSFILIDEATQRHRRRRDDRDTRRLSSASTAIDSRPPGAGHLPRAGHERPNTTRGHRMQLARRIVLGLTLTTVLSAAGASAASATTFFVAPTGNDANPCTASSAPCKTINGAVKKAELDSGTSAIEVAAGKYEETVKLPSSVEGIAINGAGGGAGGTEIAGSAAATESTVFDQASGVTISNLSVVNPAGDKHGGISGGADITLRNVFVDMRDPGTEDGIEYGALLVVGVLKMEGGGVTLESGTTGNAIDSYAYPIDLKGVAITVADGSTGGGVNAQAGSVSISSSTITLGNTAESAAVNAGFAPVTLTSDAITLAAPKGGLGVEAIGAEPITMNGDSITMNGASNSSPAIALEGGTANISHLSIGGSWPGAGIEDIGSTTTIADSRVLAKALAVENLGQDASRGLLVERSVLESAATAVPGTLVSLNGNVTVDSSEILGGRSGVYLINQAGKSRTATVAASTIDAGELGVADKASAFGVFAGAAGPGSHATVNVEGSVVLEPQVTEVEPGGPTGEVNCSNSDVPNQTQAAAPPAGAIACATGSSGNTSNSPSAIFAAPLTGYIPGAGGPAVNSVPSSTISLPFGIAPSTTDLAGNPRSVLIGTNGVCPAFQDRGALQIPGQQGSCTPKPPAPPVAGVISGLAISPTTFSAAPTGATISKAKKKYGAKISYRDSQAASTTLTVWRRSTGRRQGKSCRKPSSSNKRGKRCVILTALGTFTHADAAGANSLHFSGRLHSRRLGTGTYTLTARAHNAAGYGPTATRTFSIH